AVRRFPRGPPRGFSTTTTASPSTRDSSTREGPTRLPWGTLSSRSPERAASPPNGPQLMENREIAAAFDKLGELLEFQGANPFRVRAYRNAAKRLRDLGEPLADMVERGEDVRKIDGIGEDLALKIHTLLTTGRLPMLEELEAKIPRGVLTLMKVPGMGPKKALLLHEQLGIESLEDLRQA